MVDVNSLHQPLFIDFEEKIVPMENIPDNTNPKKLSILICTIIERKNLLNRLLNILNKQKTDDVEVLVESDNKQISIGEKRNKLLNKAVGDYVAFIDDDDLVSDDYVKKVLQAIESKPDCCGMEGLVFFQRKKEVKKFRPNIVLMSSVTSIIPQCEKMSRR